MNKEIITSKQAICIMIFFITGTSLLIGTAGVAKRDCWISIILGIIMAVPFVIIYARILTLFRGKDIYEIVQMVFGKIFGKIIAILYIWYAFHLGALVLRNFGEFINVVAMPETPMLVPMFMIGVLCIMVVSGGVEIIGRTSKFFFPIIVAVLVLVNLLGITELNFDNIKPILYDGFLPVFKGAFSAFSFPFAETVLFTTILFALQPKKSVYNVYLWGLLIGGIIILIICIRNILVLGPDIAEILYFPSHVAVGRIEIGDFIQRIEVTVSIVLVVGTFIKASICLYAACKGISSLFGMKNYRNIVLQTGLLMIYFSSFIYESTMQMEHWAFEIYSYYALPFQVILPIIILIAAEIKVRKGDFKISENRS
ncbi:MAG TPA: spore gernimation protein [Clostridiales bacterium]|nr:MAG: spore gernimation protein [Clostridiales bacterium GWD2_32_19]HCC06629.1 spore gernimation protein [Clostridiales bacterium]